MALPKDAITGGCQCGAVRYALEPKPYKIYVCHCLECQKQSASAFGLSMPLKFEDLALEGETAEYVRSTDSGARTRCIFCRQCGTRLYHRSDRSPEFVTIKAGTLDETHSIKPVAHIWVSRKQPWVVLDDDVPAYASQPPDLKGWRDELIGNSGRDK
ncbi:glutathione-dependent formaldehyde-activating enzyme [bacterium BMS3Bbin10]|nr:glutathione-dependent formaldehyde-activating enzyme [bacterium BMS3Bbin10]HDL16739.1 GFA family protein [Hyphomicrobiales bacterium]